jgi:hypothetical protein
MDLDLHRYGGRDLDGKVSERDRGAMDVQEVEWALVEEADGAGLPRVG